jgi:RNA polymerase sigma factor (sigma-70 family)
VNERALAVAAAAGSHEAFRALVDPLRRELHLFCYRMLGSFHDAEDVVQEAHLKAWRAIGSFDGRAPFRTWMYRVALNTTRDAMRARRRRVLPQDLGAPRNPEEGLGEQRADIDWLEPFYGAGCQDARSLHAVGSVFGRRRPHSLSCRIGRSAQDARCALRASRRCWEDGHSRGVLRSEAGTILLSGAHWPIASFGSPGAHSLSVGTRTLWSSPEIQWMLSPVTSSLPLRRARLRVHRVRSNARRSGPELLRRRQSLWVVHLPAAP